MLVSPIEAWFPLTFIWIYNDILHCNREKYSVCFTLLSETELRYQVIWQGQMCALTLMILSFWSLSLPLRFMNMIAISTCQRSYWGWVYWFYHGCVSVYLSVCLQWWYFAHDPSRTSNNFGINRSKVKVKFGLWTFQNFHTIWQ